MAGDLNMATVHLFLGFGITHRGKNKKTREFQIFSETSNGRLPLEHGSNRRETLPKRVSGDSQRFIFRRQ